MGSHVADGTGRSDTGSPTSNATCGTRATSKEISAAQDQLRTVILELSRELGLGAKEGGK